MSSRVWLLLVGLVLSLLIGGCAAPAPEAGHPVAAVTSAVPATPAADPLGDDDAITPPLAEAALAEAIEAPLAEPALRTACAQQQWLRSAHATAPVGPVLDGPLRPPKAIA